MVERDRIEYEGFVEETSKGIFKVMLDSGLSISCTLSGKIRVNAVRILVGDRVKVEVSPYETTKGRIVYRIR